jgi:hypothetical protein
MTKKVVSVLHAGTVRRFNQLILLKLFFLTRTLLKHHLDGGIRKDALTQEQADAKLAAWLELKLEKLMLRRRFDQSTSC